MKPSKPDAEFEALCHSVLDGAATEEDLQRLEQLVLSSPTLRKRYGDLSQLHAALWLREEGVDAPAVPRNVTPGSSLELGKVSTLHGWRTVSVGVALAAMLLLVAFGWPGWNADSPKSFATMLTNEWTRWESATVPIASGSRIGPARLRLASGLSTLHFDNGVRIDLEGPADLELMSPMRCRIHSGNLVATVGSDLKGFVVETPNAILTDQGTSFGVRVAGEVDSSVEVFDGQVDVEHRRTGQFRSITENSSVRVVEGGLVPADEGREGPSRELVRRRVVQITTATGRGEDHWIQRDESARKGPEDLLLAKDCWPKWEAYDRRIHLRFDFSGVPMTGLARARLQLMATPSKMGFASRTPDTIFAVYGSKAPVADDWSPETLAWDSSPGISGGIPEQETWQLLGRFTIPKGQPASAFFIEGPELIRVLQSKTNGLVSFLVVCETPEKGAGGLVHAFASSRHETLPPPTLRMWYAP